MLYNGLGRYDDGAGRGRARPRASPTSWASSTWALAELIEAAVRSGKPELAAERARAARGDARAPAAPTGRSGSRRARARCSATAKPPSASTARRSSGSAARRSRVDLARAHLLYGEWLRRERRRRRRPRAAAHRATRCSPRWAPRRSPSAPRRELLATGETRAQAHRRDARRAHRRRRPRSRGSPRDGLSNPEIGARLFISPRTVEYHLRKVFTKLEISSRNQLPRVLPSEAQPV